jgi:hypothetical protein
MDEKYITLLSMDENLYVWMMHARTPKKKLKNPKP